MTETEAVVRDWLLTQPKEVQNDVLKRAYQIAKDDLPPRAVPDPMLVPAPVEGREGRASSGTRATA